MTEEASLDRFAPDDPDDRGEDARADRDEDPGADRDADAGTDSSVAAGDGPDSDAVADASEHDDPERSDPTEVAPAASTYAWSPEGGECAACGRTVKRRWRADGEREGELVCADCKEW